MGTRNRLLLSTPLTAIGSSNRNGYARPNAESVERIQDTDVLAIGNVAGTVRQRQIDAAVRLLSVVSDSEPIAWERHGRR